MEDKGSTEPNPEDACASNIACNDDIVWIGDDMYVVCGTNWCDT